MEPDIVLLWLGLFSSVAVIVIAPGRLWLGKAVALLLGGAALVVWWPAIAGWVVGVAWAILIAVPLLLTTIARRLMLAQRNRTAQIVLAVLWPLHPDRELRGHIELLGGLVTSRRGLHGPAIAQFARLAANPSLPRAITLTALMHQRRLEGAFERLLDEVDWSNEEPTLAIVIRLRALATLGRVDAMIAEYGGIGERLSSQRSAAAAFRRLAMLPLFFATGTVGPLDRLLRGSFSSLPAGHQSYYRAVATITAGGADVASGQAALCRLAVGRDRDVALSAARELQAARAPVVLDAAQRAIVDRAAAELDAAIAAQRARPRLRAAPVTLLLIVANLVAYAVEIAEGGSTDSETLLRLGALWPPAVLEGGEWWRILSANFLHLGWIHLASNMFALLLVGAVTERALGWWRMGGLYVVSGLGAMAGIIALVAAGRMQSDLVVGASGAIMGLIGALLFDAVRDWWVSRTRIARFRMVWIIGVVVVQSILDVATPEISFAGHAFGLAIGFCVAGVLSFGRRGTAPIRPVAPASPLARAVAQPMDRRRILLVTAALAIAVAASALFPERRDAALVRDLLHQDSDDTP